MAEGIDYSFGSGITATQIKAAGKAFVCRYLATLPNPKCITKAEFTNLRSAGLNVVLVWETTADRPLAGHAAGAADAKAADAQAAALGAPGIPLYFACDFDAAPGQQAAINAYCQGVASVIGHARTGLYGSYYVIERAFNAKAITYGWQTYAWSGGQWDSRAQLQQYRNAVRIGPADVDLDRSAHPDYGQWPRPGAAPKPPAPPGKQMPGTRKGPFTLKQAQGWEADGTMSLDAVMASRNSRAVLSVALTYENASIASVSNMNAYISGGTSHPMPAGLVFCTANP